MTAPVDLHALGYGAVVTVAPSPHVVLVALNVGDDWWMLSGRERRYTTGDLLAMSQGWTVLRTGTGDADDLDAHYDDARRITRDPVWQDGYTTGFADQARAVVDLDNLDGR